MNKRILLLSLLLAACGSGEDNSSEAATGGAVIEDTPTNLQEDPNNKVVPLTPATNIAAPVVQASPSPIAVIPSSFQGRWGMVPADCEPGRDDAKGLMTVADGTLSFYESRARASDLRQLSPTAITATLAYSGEGQNWQRQARLMLVDDGRTLLREEQGEEQAQGAPVNGRYSRCPG